MVEPDGRAAATGVIRQGDAMRTPAGTDCKYYYEDFHRGYNIQECRLVERDHDTLSWRPADCEKCPVPAILHANASPDLALKLVIKPRFLGMRRQIVVTASCLKHLCPVDDPHVGCLQCNNDREGLNLFWQALEHSESSEDDENHHTP